MQGNKNVEAMKQRDKYVDIAKGIAIVGNVVRTFPWICQGKVLGNLLLVS